MTDDRRQTTAQPYPFQALADCFSGQRLPRRWPVGTAIILASRRWETAPLDARRRSNGVLAISAGH